ncbi:MAG: hypothetical protein WAM85_12345 [Terracidiphilus sp.]
MIATLAQQRKRQGSRSRFPPPANIAETTLFQSKLLNGVLVVMRVATIVPVASRAPDFSVS